MKKKCRFCGEPLPEKASFCPHCARSQLFPRSAPEPVLPRKRRPWGIPFLICAALLAVAGCLLGMKKAPVPPEETAQEAAAETTPETTRSAAQETEAAQDPTYATMADNGIRYTGFRNGQQTELNYYYRLGGSLNYTEYYSAGNPSYVLISSDSVHGEATTYREDGTSIAVRYVEDVRQELMEHGVDLSQYPPIE